MAPEPCPRLLSPPMGWAGWPLRGSFRAMAHNQRRNVRPNLHISVLLGLAYILTNSAPTLHMGCHNQRALTSIMK